MNQTNFQDILFYGFIHKLLIFIGTSLGVHIAIKARDFVVNWLKLDFFYFIKQWIKKQKFKISWNWKFCWKANE